AYVPLIGVFVATAWLAAGAAARSRTARHAVTVLALGILLALAAAARRQMGYWKDTVTLFQREVATSDQQYARDPKVLNTLGMMMLRQDRERALVYFQRAVDLDPTSV